MDGPTTTSATAPAANANAYQLTLGGLAMPIKIHVVFNAVALAAVLVLGHPVVAGLAFLASCAMDILYQRTIARWLARSAHTEVARGFRQLALLCVARVSIYLSGPTILALWGGQKELAYLAITVASMVAVACASGSLSRAVFWSFAGPAVLALTGTLVAIFPPAAFAGLMISMACLMVLLVMISDGTTRAVTSWQEAYASNLAMIPQLEAARDHAMAETRAADEAREVARQANLAKSNFLATMSHEIRTPMNGVLGMAQLLRREETDPVQASRLETLMESGEHLLSILNDILDMSKVNAGRLDITPTPENLPLFLDRAVAFWRARADEKAVALRLEVDEDLPSHVWMDAIRVRQVLFNLIGNALKFTDEGAVTVRAAARPVGETAVRIHISVIDTGPGIPEEYLPALFERFSQVDESEARRFGGTGLGLAIASQLTELMGGRVWVESQLGQGSTFHMEAIFDLAQAPDSAPAEPVTEDAPAAELDVLIVDDNPINLLVLQQILCAFGHRVEKAASGQAALDLLASRPFDLTLMDIQMPGMTGVQALQRLRASPGPNQAIPVIALTADVTSGGRTHYLELGFTEHTAKPIQIPDLMSAISRALADTERERLISQAG
ncbi:MAG: ATP-binding protein [Phenylobacterium sp.]|uniref:ATP-binding protein n=1 Tax=Phenylobacterium sp. TaxID=1871053 RepID=UPI0027246627|nr:ATP-binding protein [Phenylobacterium sp.]MDO8911361.1 ATP-binding protein [Phenylobacterium sp.]MDP3099064.1 ATP-binding protein [Phenylobacterium sp.]MDP3633174.1 ATP-binding protein [Phenylobacterium sp.]MDP3870695.1 ATP-binding protein [Phenylobacterium sp.]